MSAAWNAHDGSFDKATGRDFAVSGKVVTIRLVCDGQVHGKGATNSDETMKAEVEPRLG